MMVPTAPDVPAADAARATIRQVALWWCWLVAIFACAALVVSAALGFLVPAMDARLAALATAATERAVVEESADLAARVIESSTREQRQTARRFLAAQITILERIRDHHNRPGAEGDGTPAHYRAAWLEPDGPLYRYVASLHTVMDESDGGTIPPLPPTPDEALAVIDHSLVLQSQRARTIMTLAVAGAGLVLALAVVFGLLSLTVGLRPALAGFQAALRSNPIAGRTPCPPAAGPSEMVAQALDQGQPMVIITSTTGIIEYANASFLTNNGYTAGEVTGQPIRILSSGLTPQGTYRVVWETLLEGRVWTGEFCNRRSDGSCYWVQATISPVRDGTGRVVRFIAIEQAITPTAPYPAPVPRHAGGGGSDGPALRNGPPLP